MAETTKERRVDAGAILELAAEVRALAMAVEHDRQDRRRERDEDRAILKEWREGQERRLGKLEDLLLQPPDGLAHQVQANTAARYRMRFWLQAMGSALAVMAVGAVWKLIVK